MDQMPAIEYMGYSCISISRCQLSLGCLYSSHALSAIFSGFRFFSFGDTTPPTESRAMCLVIGESCSQQDIISSRSGYGIIHIHFRAELCMQGQYQRPLSR